MRNSFMKKISLTTIVTLITVLALSVTAFGSDVFYQSVDTKEKSKAGNVTYAYGVTDEMCKADYWTARTKTNANEVLMNAEEIDAVNANALNTEGTNMNDIVGLPLTYNAFALRDSLAHNSEIPTDPCFINGTEIDKNDYFGKLTAAIGYTGYDDSERNNDYAIVTKTVEVRNWPTSDVVGYSANDTDDELVLVTLNVNDPFVIRQKAEVDGKTYYWGYCDTVTGWVPSENVAICQDKDEWLEAWQVKTSAKDFVVVTQDKITLEPNIYDAYPSNIKLNFSSILKLVSESDIPKNIGERGTWNNYIVYVPTRNDSGKYERKIAMISEHFDVSVGFVPMTQANLLKLSLACLGNRYGWGGMLDSMDCSMLTRNVYRCCGFVLPRNTNWQQNIPGTKTDLEGKTDEEKMKILEKMPAGTMLYFPGHTMLFLGIDNGAGYVVSDLGGVVDTVGELTTYSVQSVTVTPLTVRRKKNGLTWLTNLTAAGAFKIPEPTPETTTVVPTTVKPTVTPETKLPGTTFTKVKAKKKSLKLAWKKVSNITGYKLQVARKKSFKKAKTYTVKKTKKTIKGLKKKKTYYLRIRTYKVEKSNNKEIYYYSDWSKVVKKKTK